MSNEWADSLPVTTTTVYKFNEKGDVYTERKRQRDDPRRNGGNHNYNSGWVACLRPSCKENLPRRVQEKSAQMKAAYKLQRMGPAKTKCYQNNKVPCVQSKECEWLRNTKGRCHCRPNNDGKRDCKKGIIEEKYPIADIGDNEEQRIKRADEERRKTEKRIQELKSAKSKAAEAEREAREAEQRLKRLQNERKSEQIYVNEEDEEEDEDEEPVQAPGRLHFSIGNTITVAEKSKTDTRYNELMNANSKGWIMNRSGITVLTFQTFMRFWHALNESQMRILYKNVDWGYITKKYGLKVDERSDSGFSLKGSWKKEVMGDRESKSLLLVVDDIQQTLGEAQEFVKGRVLLE